jgi:uncharacterized protein YecT (DUF1311 family)
MNFEKNSCLNQTMFCFKKICSLFLLCNCIASNASDSACLTQNSSIKSAQCASEKLRAAEALLDENFQEALGKLPESSDWDIRKTKSQLEKAQEAWRIYRDENCKYIGGLKGGNNVSVTTFSTECSLHETQQRIEFFKNLPRGG